MPDQPREPRPQHTRSTSPSPDTLTQITPVSGAALSLDTDVIPPATPRYGQRRGRIARIFARNPALRLLSIMGPGLIAANAGNDAGGIATYSQMGTQFGFQMLWVMVVVGIGVAVVQEMCARMGAATGKGLSDLIRENFPLRLTAFVMFTFLVANTGVIISEFLGIAAALRLVNVPEWIGAPIAGLLLWFLLARGSYQRVEKAFLILSLAFFAYIIAAFIAHPNVSDVLVHTVVPSFQFDTAYISLLISAVGTTISPYMQIYIQSAVVERGVRMNEYNDERAEVYIGSAFSIFVAYMIIVVTGQTLGHAGVGGGPQLDKAQDFAQALVPFLGDYAIYIFAIGLLGASFLAAGVLPLTTCYSITEALGLENGVGKSWREAPVFWAMFTVLIAVSTAIAMIPNLPIGSILVALYLLNGILLPIILFSILKLVNDKGLMGKYTNGLVYNILAYGLATLVSVLALFYVVTQILSAFGINLLG